MRAYPRPLARGAALLAIALIPLLAGCASSMYNMWRDEAFHQSPLKNVLVVALRPDAARRRVWEDGYVKGLAALGTKATASYTLWQLAPPDTQQAIEAIRRDGYDAVLVVTRLPDGAEQAYVHGYTRRESTIKQSLFTGAYYTEWKEVEVGGRYETVPVANFKTDVWTTGENGRLVWSGSNRTTNHVNAGLIKNTIEKSVLPELTKAGILPAKGK